MDHDQRLEALKADLDQLYNVVQRNEEAMREFADRVDKAFRQLSADIVGLQQSLSRR
jgi:hypothetical protein